MQRKFERLEVLEGLRGIAAVYVFVHHYVHCNDELAYLQPYFIFGQMSLMAFYALSGFVIYYSLVSRHPGMGFWDYFKGRFRRIYPILLAAMALTWALRSIAHGGPADPRLWELGGNLLQLHDKNHPGVWFKPYLDNSPLWSLSYEWWFYMWFFAIYAWMRRWPVAQKYVVFGLSAVSIVIFEFLPNPFSMYMAYWMLWWVGLELAREFWETGKVTFKGQWFSFVALTALLAMWGVVAYLAYRSGAPRSFGEYPFVQLRHYAGMMGILAVGLVWYKLRFVLYEYTLKPFVRAAPLTYALYITHVPIILFADSVELTGSVYIDFLWVAAVSFGLAWVLEVKYQKWANRMLR